MSKVWFQPRVVETTKDTFFCSLGKYKRVFQRKIQDLELEWEDDLLNMFQFEMHETKNLEVKRLDEVRLIIFQQYACDVFQRFHCVVVYKKG